MTDANDNFNLPPTREELEGLRQELAAANARAVEAERALSAQVEAVAPMDAQGFPEEYVKIEIYPGRDKQDLGYVPVGINGYVLKIMRGKEVIIPKVFELALKDAVEEITIQSEGGLITRPALRFPYAMKGPATKEEYQTFRAKMRAEATPATAVA